MFLHPRRFLPAALAACALAAVAAPVHAAYPDHPITLVVPQPPAGPTDILARVVAQGLGTVLGQSVIVENRPGATGGVGMQHVAHSAPDGYTLVVGGLPAQILNPALSHKLPYDPDREFEPIIPLATVQYILVVRPDLPANNVPELVKLLKANPGKFHYGTPGVGNTSHITAEMFKSAAGVDIGHVPYQGDAPAITALMSGVVDLVFTLPPGVQSAIQAGKLKPIATAAPQRSPVLPNLPTFAEQGLQGVEAQTWFSILAPAGTPADIVQKLNTALNTVLKNPDVAKRLRELGAVPAGGTVEEFKRFIATEKPKWTKLVKASGATID